MAYDNQRGGNNRFENKPYGRPAFAKKSWGDNKTSDRSDRPVTLHRATCSECGRSCEVPFKPTAGKPIFCKDCFAKRGGGTPREDGGGYPKRDFNSSPSFKPQIPGPNVTLSNDKVTKELEAVNAKLERLIRAVEALGTTKSVSKVSEVKIETTADDTQEPKKAPPKKRAKK